MINRDYCLMMARYNTWQNDQLTTLLDALDPPELTRDRGAFFGSILGTINHILWADLMWMSRLDGGDAPQLSQAESRALQPTLAAWSADRFRTDGRIRLWAQRIDSIDLTGDLTWYSGTLGATVSKPIALCVAHMFNHQTHHRGQAHAMLTATGSQAPITDLFVTPDAN